jgi:hypothetical protein
MWLVGVIVLGSVIAGTLTELAVIRMVQMPDATAATLGTLWVTMPYLAAVVLSVLFRRNKAALIVLLVSLLIVSFVGVSMFDASATEQEVLQKEADNTVLPGEDPHRGPAGMRKANADMGVAAGGLFSILLAVILPPVQLATVTIPTVIGNGIAVLRRRRDIESSRSK